MRVGNVDVELLMLLVRVCLSKQTIETYLDDVGLLYLRLLCLVTADLLPQSEDLWIWLDPWLFVRHSLRKHHQTLIIA